MAPSGAVDTLHFFRFIFHFIHFLKLVVTYALVDPHPTLRLKYPTHLILNGLELLTVLYFRR